MAGLRKDVFDGIVGLLISEGKLVERKHCLALPEHQEKFSDEEQELLRNIESLFRDRLFSPPGFDEVVESVSIAPEEVRKIIRVMVEQERLVRIDKELLFHSDAIEKARELLISFIKEKGGLESVKFKYLLNTTRKFAIPLLDYFDRIGLTLRDGYTRYLRSPVR